MLEGGMMKILRGCQNFSGRAGINNSSPGRQIYRSTVYIVFMSMVILPTWTSISEGDISILSPNPLIAIDVCE